MDSNDPVQLGPASPFLIVRDVTASLAFYRDALGFSVPVVLPQGEPFSAIVARGTAQLLLKSAPGIEPEPNPTRHPNLRWDCSVLSESPDSLAAEFEGRGVALHVPLGDTEDDLRGSEVRDVDEHVLFFGCPVKTVV